MDWIQLREKDLEGRTLFDLAARAVALCDAAAPTAGKKPRILINDRLDVAWAAHAGGVHLGENSLPPGEVTRWRKQAGRSRFSGGRLVPFARSRHAGGCGRRGLHFFRAGLRHAVEASVRRSAGIAEIGACVWRRFCTCAGHWRNHDRECGRMPRGRSGRDRRHSPVPTSTGAACGHNDAHSQMRKRSHRRPAPVSRCRDGWLAGNWRMRYRSLQPWTLAPSSTSFSRS